MSAHIRVEGLRKTYRIPERDAGMWGALRSVVHRRYRTVEALSDVSFTLQRGELLGFIGPNGAGKSTTIKILSGILRPDGGLCEVDGLTPWRSRIAHVARIGVVFGQRTQLFWDLPVREGFGLLRSIYRVPEASYRRTEAELVELLRIEPLLDQPVRLLSLGQRMRCELAASMLHEPSLLFLDEPTIGLDAPSKLAVREFIQRLNRERGVTVLLTTHDMHDIEALAQRVIVIGHGRLLSDGSFEQLRAKVLHERLLVIDFADVVPSLAIEGATERAREGRRLTLAFDPTRITAPSLIARIAASYEVEDVHVEQPRIEQVISRFYDQLGAVEA
ncbi:MAG: ABC transporter ATP-binding protein [Polyangiales bacterium]